MKAELHEEVMILPEIGSSSEGMYQVRKTTITLSIPVDLLNRLHQQIQIRGRSKTICQMIERGLDADLNASNQEIVVN